MYMLHMVKMMLYFWIYYIHMLKAIIKKETTSELRRDEKHGETTPIYMLWNAGNKPTSCTYSVANIHSC